MKKTKRIKNKRKCINKRNLVKISTRKKRQKGGFFGPIIKFMHKKAFRQ